MTKLGKKHQKQLAKLVAAALICAGGGLFSPPSVASAEEVTVTGVGGTSGAYTVTSIPGGVMVPAGGWNNYFYAPNYDVLNITNTISANNIRFYGGYNGNPGTCVSGKTVNVNGTTIFVNSIRGGMNESGNVEGNTVNVASGTITVPGIIGGVVESHGSDLSGEGSALNNHVNITGGTINKGGYGCSIYGGRSTKGDAENNTVTISGGDIYAGDICGGSTSRAGKKANGNVVTIHGGTFNGDSTSAIQGGSAGSIVGANGNEASGNTVTIDGGTVNVKRIYGGSASRIMSVVDTEASGNTVTIEKDATLGSDTCIFGGYAQSGFPPNQVLGTTNNNTVNILKAITVKQIVGGSNVTAGTGNTLNVNAIGVTVGDYGVTGFQNMNFYLPEGAAGKTMLTVNEKDADGDGVATDLTGVTIGAAVQAGANFNKGDTVNLITNPSGLTTDGTTTMKQITEETVTIQTKPTAKTLTTDQSYKLEVSQKDENTIIATITDTEEKQNGERAKSLVETRAATTTFVNAGADMLASQGFTQAANAVALDAAEAAKNGTGAQNVGGFTPFAALGGSSMRAESGSYVNTKGFGLNVGFARELPNAQGKLLFGPVIEYGGGSYDSHLDDGTRGEGKAHYVGVGVMARQVNNDGFYYEGSLRGGRVTSDYKGDLDSIGRVDYDSSANYFAAHLGVGKAFALGNGNTLDGYCKYFYSHQAGDDTTVHIAGMADERGHFDTVDSHRIRIGARLTHKVNERNSYYGGLAYQYEFKGDARATFSGNGVPSPSIKGSSGMLELGWQVKPGEGPLHLDLGVTGWAGKQRGGNVQLGATWTF